MFVKLKKSSVLNEKFKQLCSCNGVTYQKPIIDVVTRWNSTLNMIERAIDLMPVIQTLTSLEKEFKNLFVDQNEVNSLNSLISLLKELELATKLLEGDQNPLIPNYIIIFDYIQSY